MAGERDIGKWDIFYYVYGVLHQPGYRAKFADNLKRELPRIPFAPDFWAFADAGKELAGLHLDNEKVEPYPLLDPRGPLIGPGCVVESLGRECPSEVH